MDGGKGGSAGANTPLFQPRDVNDTASIMEFLNGGESEPPQRRKRRGSAGRRVSFADITKVHVFARDDEYETPPEAHTEDLSAAKTAARRRSPRLAGKLKRKESLDEARVALAPRFDIATPNADASPSVSPGEWILERGTPDPESAEMDLENTGPVDLRHLRSGEKDADILGIIDVDADDVTRDTPRLAELLRADGNTTQQTLNWNQQGFGTEPSFTDKGRGALTGNDVEMSFTEIPSKWPLQSTCLSIADSDDCTSDMSLSSESPLQQFLKATSEEEDGAGGSGFVDVELLSSQTYEEGMQGKASLDMDYIMDTLTDELRFGRSSTPDRKIGKRSFNRSLLREGDYLSSPSNSGRNGVDKVPEKKRIQVNTMKVAPFVDKENQVPSEFTPSRPVQNREAKRAAFTQTGNASATRAMVPLLPMAENWPNELLNADNTVIMLSDKGDISMVTPRLSELLMADETETLAVTRTIQPFVAEGGITITTSRLEENKKAATPDVGSPKAGEPNSQEPVDRQGQDSMPQQMTMVQLLQEYNLAKKQLHQGERENIDMAFTEIPKSLAESLRFSCLLKPQMQLLDVWNSQLKMAVDNQKSEIEKSLSRSPASTSHLQRGSIGELQAKFQNIEHTARKTASKQFCAQDFKLKILHENKMILEKEVHRWENTMRSQKNVQELVKDFQGRIATLGLAVRNTGHKVSRNAELHTSQAADLLRIQKQIAKEEDDLTSREALLVQREQARQDAKGRLFQLQVSAKLRSNAETVSLTHVRSKKNMLELLQKAQIKSYISDDQEHVSEVIYYNLICQRFFSGGNDRELRTHTSLLYLPTDLDKVYPDMNASKIFLALLPPLENVLLEGAEVISESIQRTGRIVWKLVKLMEELQECRVAYLGCLTCPTINSFETDGFHVRFKFLDCKMGIRFLVKLYIDLSSISLNGKCEVEMEFISQNVKNALSTEALCDVVKSVQPGPWRMKRICNAVKQFFDSQKDR